MAQHLSIRVPWHDNGYIGTVCKNPCDNTSCLRLKNIFENKNDDYEASVEGSSIAGKEQNIPCVSEGGAFMSPYNLTKTTIHPYKASNPKTHSHFLETPVVYPAYSLPARPFRWTMKDDNKNNTYSLADIHNIHYDPNREPVLRFDSIWMQDAENHKEIFKYFYHDVKPKESMCLIYAKQVPFVEDTRRVIMGLGLVEKVIPAIEHKHTNDGKLKSMTWETMLCHTIRDDMKNGFLFPYREMMKYAEENPGFDIRKVTVFAPEEYYGEFSYATEHVSYDAVISVLLQSLKALNVIKTCIEGKWNDCIEWVSKKLSEVWQDRGAFPGIGSMLCATGFQFGILIAEELKYGMTKGEEIWEKLDRTIAAPDKYLSPEIAASVSKLNQKGWNGFTNERKTLFKLLSRFTLTLDQALCVFNIEYRQKYQIECKDSEIIANPYIVYELTRDKVDWLQIPVSKVDLAVFPPLDIRKQFPLEAPSALTSDNDERRIRAISVDLLEKQAENGHTVYPCNNLVLELNDLPIEPKCNATRDILESISDFLENEISTVEMKNNDKAFQLQRLKIIDELISTSVSRRVNTTKRHDVNENWRKIVDDTFSDTYDENEERARQEKTEILKELSAARLSVLVGGAGTGKTTLLSILCSSKKIQDGGILLLAPTGKARVRMSQAMADRKVPCNAKTVAQFLIQNDRFDFETMRYKLSDTTAKDVPDTVIVDESSMLTEEMFGALLQALKSAGRIIFVGDPNQLPPIGAGRPFVDLVRSLNKELSPYVFPKVCKSYGELRITRRQKSLEDGSERYDAELAKWFINDETSFDEEIFEKIQGNRCGNFITFKTWKTGEDLENILLDTIAEELNMKDVDDIDGFDKSLGGKITDNGTYFNLGCAKYAEDWQILAPVRNMPHGVININHLIHRKYREDLMALAKRSGYKKIPSPMGPEGIIYGDKVINVVNKKREAYPKTADAINYVANGEIGITGCVFNSPSWGLKVEFSSQANFNYTFNERDFGEETEALLELAYALTVHKAQGSEFKKVILVLNEPCNLISKELMYTAITRQVDRLVILYNDEAYHLRNYSCLACSEIARRFTNLFDEPDIVKVHDRYYEANMIHKTFRGELVRSKSEVIIADALYHNKVEYEYEKELIINGIRKIPDFTMNDAETGDCVYWEHCGMMTDDDYRKRWEAKKALYEKNGIVEGENLIVTYDDEKGGIDSQVIQNYVNKYFK